MCLVGDFRWGERGNESVGNRVLCAELEAVTKWSAVNLSVRKGGEIEGGGIDRN